MTRIAARSVPALALLLAAPAALPAPAQATPLVAPLARADLAVTRPTTTSVKACGSGSAAGYVAGSWLLTATGSGVTQTRGPVAGATLPTTCITFGTSGVGTVLVTLTFVGASTAGEGVGLCTSSVTFDGGTPVILTACPRGALEQVAA